MPDFQFWVEQNCGVGSDLNQAREIISDWRQDYNERRPHSTLTYLTPLEFAANYRSGKNDTTQNDITS